MIRGKFLTSRDDISPVIAIRRKVFCDEQGFSPDSEPDIYDSMSIYALVFDDNDMPIATGRLYVDDDRLKIGRVCVLKAYRGRQIGDFVMRMLLYRAQELNAGSVTLSAQTDSVGFYARYGFKPIGDIIYEEGKPHRIMRVEGDKINIEGSCHCQKKCDGCADNCAECQAVNDQMHN